MEQLEVLLWIAEHDGKEWSAADVSRELYIQSASASDRLNDLAIRRLLQASKTIPTLYRYAPADATMANTVRDLASAYNVRRVGIINLILERPLDNVRVFSNAFRIRRD